MMTLVADTGGTLIKVALMRDEIILGRESFAARSREGFEVQLPRIARGLESLCRAAGVDCGECSALALAFPSLLDSSGRVLAAYGKYADAPRLDLPRWCRNTLHLPLIIENDARMALLGEWQAGAGRGSDDLVMVTLGTGLGTAALIQGNLVRGRHGQAGILGGHFTVQHDGRLCTCGNRGCAEAEASTSALPALAAESHTFGTSALHDETCVDYARVFRLAREGDACALSLKARAIDIWSSMIVNLIHAYDPERVIVGGGIMSGEAEFFLELERLVRARAHTPWGRVAIERSELGDAAALYGGAYLSRVRNA
jgi:glucokinase